MIDRILLRLLILAVAVNGVRCSCGKSTTDTLPGAAGTYPDASADVSDSADSQPDNAPPPVESGVDTAIDISREADSTVAPEVGPTDAADAPEAFPPYCIKDYPASTTSQLVPSLSKTPAELWRKELENGEFFQEAVLAGDKIALVFAHTLFVYDRQGNPLWQYPIVQAFGGSPPLADTEGNFYFAGDAVVSLSPNGTMRWLCPLSVNLDPNNETTYTRRMLLSPDGGLFLAASDGNLYALNAKDGSMRWHKKVPEPQNQTMSVKVGVGDTLFLMGVANPIVTVPVRAQSGEFGGPTVVQGMDTSVVAASFEGLFTARYDSSPSVLGVRYWLLDSCLNAAWTPSTIDGSWEPRLVLHDNTIALSHYPKGEKAGGKVEAFVYSPGGKVLKGPKPMKGYFAVAGADGVLYSQECGNGDGTGDTKICAYSSELEELWCLSLGPNCLFTSPLLASDGVMYVTSQNPTSHKTQLIAIQTPSPGLAKSAMPVRQFNNRRTGWLGSPP